jgi:hypothetical protein
MPAWQIAYHFIVLALISLAFVGLRARNLRTPDFMIILVPVALATGAEWLINAVLWPEMLASDAQAGVGLLFSWTINAALGIVIGVLIIRKPV